MKRFVMALALACLLVTNTLAGDIPSGDFVPPPPNGITEEITDEFVLAIFSMFAM